MSSNPSQRPTRELPLLILALWHHYTATGADDFLREVYPCAAKAARYILSQRNDQGLIWCTATGMSDWGIIGWRNVIKDYTLSGATTEVNSECVAALRTVAHMPVCWSGTTRALRSRPKRKRSRPRLTRICTTPPTGCIISTSIWMAAHVAMSPRIWFSR